MASPPAVAQAVVRHPRRAAQLLHVKGYWTSAKARRAVLAFAAALPEEGPRWRYTHGFSALSAFIHDLYTRGVLNSKAMGLPMLNALGVASVGVLPSCGLPPAIHMSAARVLHRCRHYLKFPEDYSAVEFVAGRGLLDDPEMFPKISVLINRTLLTAMPEIEASLTRHYPHEVAGIARWVIQDHRRMQTVLGERLPLPLTTLQLINECVRHLRQPQVHPSLTLTDCTKLIFALANVRLTPENLIDSLAVHTLDGLLPSLKEEFSLKNPAGGMEGDDVEAAHRSTDEHDNLYTHAADTVDVPGDGLPAVCEAATSQDRVQGSRGSPEGGASEAPPPAAAPGEGVADGVREGMFSPEDVIDVATLLQRTGPRVNHVDDEEEPVAIEIPEGDSSVEASRKPRGGAHVEAMTRTPETYIRARRRTELTLLSRAIAGYARAAELGRVPLRDVLAEMARYITDHEDDILEYATSVHLLRISYLSVTLSKKWGDAAPLADEADIRRVIRNIAQLSLQPEHVEFFTEKPDYQWRFLVNLCQAGEFDSIEEWMTVLMGKPDVDPRLLATLTFTVVRYLEGTGYRDTLGTNTVEPGDDGVDDAQVGGAGHNAVIDAMPAIRDDHLIPKHDALTYREASHTIYAYGRRRILTQDLVHVMGTKLMEELETSSTTPPYLVSNFFHAIAVAWPQTLPHSEAHYFFDCAQQAIVDGRIDLAPEKPNHTVYLLFAGSKLAYTSDVWYERLCALLTDPAVERLKLSTVAMGVVALSRVTPARACVNDTVQRMVSVAAGKLALYGTTSPVSVDLVAYGLSRGPWQRENMITPLFELSKAFVGSGAAERGIPELSGKSLARLLWSHAVVAVHHTTLCSMIAKRLESPEFVAAKLDDPMSLTSCLVAMSRLALKNHRALGALCSHAAAKAHAMKAISLADTVQAVAEMAIPSRGLQYFLMSAAVIQAKTFTPQQAASFAWNLARCGMVPGSVHDVEKQHLLDTCYAAMFDIIMPCVADLEVKYVCRLHQVLGLLGRDSCVARHLPVLLKRAMRRIDDVWWRDLANVLWALAVLQHRPGDDDVNTLQLWRQRQNFLPDDIPRVAMWDAFVAPEMHGHPPAPAPLSVAVGTPADAKWQPTTTPVAASQI